jgi:hypothetical protein
VEILEQQRSSIEKVQTLLNLPLEQTDCQNKNYDRCAVNLKIYELMASGFTVNLEDSPNLNSLERHINVSRSKNEQTNSKFSIFQSFTHDYYEPYITKIEGEYFKNNEQIKIALTFWVDEFSNRNYYIDLTLNNRFVECSLPADNKFLSQCLELLINDFIESESDPERTQIDYMSTFEGLDKTWFYALDPSQTDSVDTNNYIL